MTSRSGTILTLRWQGSFFHGVLETPGRSVPWVDDSFNYSFRGGLEPGEKQHLRLVPNRFGDWDHQDLRTLIATILTVRVVDAEMASGDRLADNDGDDLEKLRDDLSQLESARKDLQDKIDRLRAELAVAS